MIPGDSASEDTKKGLSRGEAFFSSGGSLPAARSTPRAKNGMVILAFLRWPELGRVKTRLAAKTGDEKACALYKSMAEHTIGQAIGAVGKESVIVMSTGADVGWFSRWLGDDLTYQAQEDGGLGTRLQSAFSRAFRDGCATSVAIGGDCPGLSEAILRRGRLLLADYDVVIGPALDGGYYLIGLQSHVTGLFEGIKWGTAEVFNQTMRLCRDNNYEVALLEPMRDVDTLEDAVALGLADGAGNVIWRGHQQFFGLEECRPC